MTVHIPCSNPDCRQFLAVTADWAGEHVRCPACGCATEIPQTLFSRTPVAAAVPISQLQEPARQSCPGCNAPLPPEAVLCVACGFDLRVGKRLTTVREQKARATIPLGLGSVVAWSGYLLGGLLVFAALIAVVVQSPLWAFVLFLLGVGLAAGGFFLGQKAVAKVTVSRQAKGEILCSIVYQLFQYPVHRRRIYLTPNDRLVLCHEIPVAALVFFLGLLCLGIIPGLLWWYLLLGKRTSLQIRDIATGEVEHVSILWGDEGIRDLINTIWEVEHLTVERG
jgi:hypothetical protein